MLWLMLCILSLWCFIAMVSKLTFLITLLQKGLIYTSVKANLGGSQNKIYSVSAVQISVRLFKCRHSIVIHAPSQIMFAMLRYFVAVAN